MSSRAPRPPLTKRLRRSHWIALDCVVGAGVGAIALVTTIPIMAMQVDNLPYLAVPLAIFAAVGFRRRWPVAAYVVVLAAAIVGGRTNVAMTLVLLLPDAYILYTVTVTRSRRVGAAALATGLLLILGCSLVDFWDPYRQTAAVQAGIPVAFAVILGWMTGYSVRQRRAYAAMLTQQAASSAVAEERLRIARELHDIVAHSMSVIAVQAGFGQYVIDSDVNGARSALGAIQETSRDALDEMRRMLGVLRQQDGAGAGPAPLAPACGLRDLDRLAERARAAGVSVSLRREGAAPPLPPSIELSGYRIVQEALTNVVKHAGPGARCEVTVRYAAEVLTLTITDDGGDGPATPSQSSGQHGIAGMRERVALCGGEFSAGPLPGGGFEVTARLPASTPAMAGSS